MEQTPPNPITVYSKGHYWLQLIHCAAYTTLLYLTFSPVSLNECVTMVTESKTWKSKAHLLLADKISNTYNLTME